MKSESKYTKHTMLRLELTIFRWMDLRPRQLRHWEREARGVRAGESFGKLMNFVLVNEWQRNCLAKGCRQLCSR